MGDNRNYDGLKHRFFLDPTPRRRLVASWAQEQKQIPRLRSFVARSFPISPNRSVFFYKETMEKLSAHC
jgi:hypothetical protein